jgi:hypothetical protein
VLELYPSSSDRYYWNLLAVRLHMPVWGIGVLQLSETSIMLFGGYDGNDDRSDVMLLEISETQLADNEAMHEE